MPDRLTVGVGERQTTALVYPAEGTRRLRATLVLAHGAGAGQTSPFMVRFATGLAARGLDVLTFNFLYTEAQRRLPDRAPILEACYRAIVDTARRHPPFEGNRVFIGGKSMGGRIATHLAAADDGPGPAADGGSHAGTEAHTWTHARPAEKAGARSGAHAGVTETAAGDYAGLVLLGYPLHSPGTRDRLRVEHLPRIRVPMLFLQGSRDPFGTPDELRPHLARLPVPATLHAVEHGDHSLAPPKRGPVTVEQAHGRLQDVIAAWVADRL